jgi:hypothetical protein
VEKHFRENVPEDFLAEASVKDTAAKMAAPLVNRFKARLEQDALRMLKTGKQASEILAGLQSKYGSKM